MTYHRTKTRLVKVLLIGVTCIVSAVAGLRRADAQCYTIKGIGRPLSSCYVYTYCGISQMCIHFQCHGSGVCGPNGGQLCTFVGCGDFTACSSPCV